MKLNHDIVSAYKVLDGEKITESEAMSLTGVSGNDILDLVSLANKVRDKFAPKIVACSIINAKSGVCSQNCKFCAQSGHHRTGAETYALLPPEEILASARRIYDLGVRSYGIVTSGFGYTEPGGEFNRIIAAMDLLRRELPELKLCLSLGVLSETTARMLAEHGAWRYNMNLQTNPDRYAELISDTHSIVAKIQTIRYLQKHGVSICCGGILGLGESWQDRVKMAFACRDLDVDGIPLNVLLPIEGTPLEDQPVMDAADVAKAFAIFRLVNPGRMIKFAAGRETAMKDFQGLLMLAGMNSMITGGYLTTRGRSVEEDRGFLHQLTLFTENA
ncbi:MAG: biotin synthase BioB [Victivallaceae bacterium]|nr:biotin synthase BioB [Victivallaceae bacterium]